MGDEPQPVSRSAQGVLFIRAQLNAVGAVDDPVAKQLLPPKRQRLLEALQSGPLWRLTRRSSGPYLAIRTRFFDRFVTEVIHAGVRQIVILAAGYDTRAWRLARPGVSFFEVDRPATQADKRAHAPEGGPVFVPTDVTDQRLVEMLASAGLRADEAVAFIAEGLAIYMDEADVADLFTRLARFAAPGSQIAVSFEAGFQHKPIMRRVMLTYYRQSQETYRFRLARDDAPRFFTASGWMVDDVLVPAALAPTFLSGTKLAGVKIESPSFFVVARV